MRTRVKICGITRPEDGLAAARLGADAIGLVFYARSPRAVDAERAAAIVRSLPPFVTAVGLFVDAPRADIEAVLARVPLGLLQFHGDECPADCGTYGLPYIKAVRMRPGLDLAGFAGAYPDAAGLLLDAYVAGVPGGTGERFDWGRIPRDFDRPLILAGGLDADNVAAAIEQVRPYGVDVSGGVEAAKGIKDHQRLQAFFRGVEHG